MEDDERAVLRVEAPERPLHEVAVGEVAGRVGAGGLVDLDHLDLDGPAAPAARLVEAGVHEEAMEPGIEAVRVTKPGQVPPRAQQGVLDGVACELRVAKDESRGRVQAGSGGRREHGEGVVIAPTGSLDESPLVHGPSPWAGHVAGC